jgi:uncharacterized protein
MSKQRMSDASVERLDAIMEQRVVPHGGMSLEMLDGFLSALMVTPELVPPSEYLPYVWNDAQVWDTPEEAGEALGLVMALWNDVSRRMSVPLPDPEQLEEAISEDLLEAAAPLLAIPADLDLLDDAVVEANCDLPLASAWAGGFMLGVSLRGELWEAWAEDEEAVADDLEDLSRLALFDLEQAKELGYEGDDIPGLTERLEMIAELPFLVQDLNWRRLQRQRPQTVRRPELPGRNDPCVCGSGLKFKKCCGAPGKLN